MPPTSHEVPDRLRAAAARYGPIGTAGVPRRRRTGETESEIHHAVGQRGHQLGVECRQGGDVEPDPDRQLNPVDRPVKFEHQAPGTEHAGEHIRPGGLVPVERVDQVVEADVPEAVQVAGDPGQGEPTVRRAVDRTQRQGFPLLQPDLQHLHDPPAERSGGRTGLSVDIRLDHFSPEERELAHQTDPVGVRTRHAELELELLVPAPEHPAPVVQRRLADGIDADRGPTGGAGDSEAESREDGGLHGGGRGPGREQPVETLGLEGQTASLGGRNAHPTRFQNVGRRREELGVRQQFPIGAQGQPRLPLGIQQPRLE